MSPRPWQHWLDRLYDLRRDKRGNHERPHKPTLLLALFERMDRAGSEVNAFPPDEELVRSFRRIFEVVRQRDDRPTMENPYFHLCSDGFWELVPAPGEAPAYVPGSVSGTPSLAALRRQVQHGRFVSEFWELVREPVARHQIREAIMVRYFPEKRIELQLAAGAAKPMVAETGTEPELPPGRDAAFRRIVLDVYDYTCAACGARLVMGNDALVEAAHIVPFSIERNDKPTNGLALCPNHHWAMDRFLIAPCPDAKERQGVWRVSRRLDDRLHGQRDLVALAGRPVIPPGEEKFYPAPEALRWRGEKLATG